jgi:serine/threonine protein kinase
MASSDGTRNKRKLIVRQGSYEAARELPDDPMSVDESESSRPRKHSRTRPMLIRHQSFDATVAVAMPNDGSDLTLSGQRSRAPGGDAQAIAAAASAMARTIGISAASAVAAAPPPPTFADGGASAAATAAAAAAAQRPATPPPPPPPLPYDPALHCSFINPDRHKGPWVISDRFVLQQLVGGGSYKEVATAYDKQTESLVVVAKICGVFDDLQDARRILREIRILRQLKHERIVKLLDVLPPARSIRGTFKDLYIVFERMDADLDRILKTPQSLTPQHTQVFIFQLLCALAHIHSANVIHRDLKPANLLIQVCARCSVTPLRSVAALVRVVDTAHPLLLLLSLLLLCQPPTLDPANRPPNIYLRQTTSDNRRRQSPHLYAATTNEQCTDCELKLCDFGLARVALPEVTARTRAENHTLEGGSAGSGAASSSSAPAAGGEGGASASAVAGAATSPPRPLGAARRPIQRQVSFLLYRYIIRESCSQFDSLPLTSLTISRGSTPPWS